MTADYDLYEDAVEAYEKDDEFGRDIADEVLLQIQNNGLNGLDVGFRMALVDWYRTTQRYDGYLVAAVDATLEDLKADARERQLDR